jgi:hypothetical protein
MKWSCVWPDMFAPDLRAPATPTSSGIVQRYMEVLALLFAPPTYGLQRTRRTHQDRLTVQYGGGVCVVTSKINRPTLFDLMISSSSPKNTLIGAVTKPSGMRLFSRLLLFQVYTGGTYPMVFTRSIYLDKERATPHVYLCTIKCYIPAHINTCVSDAVPRMWVAGIHRPSFLYTYLWLLL